MNRNVIFIIIHVSLCSVDLSELMFSNFTEEMSTEESSTTNEEGGSEASDSEKKVKAAPPPKECEINYTSAENKYYRKNIDGMYFHS